MEWPIRRRTHNHLFFSFSDSTRFSPCCYPCRRHSRLRLQVEVLEFYQWPESFFFALLSAEPFFARLVLFLRTFFLRTVAAFFSSDHRSLSFSNGVVFRERIFQTSCSLSAIHRCCLREVENLPRGFLSGGFLPGGPFFFFFFETRFQLASPFAHIRHHPFPFFRTDWKVPSTFLLRCFCCSALLSFFPTN